jgi:hypothetical protein
VRRLAVALVAWLGATAVEAGPVAVRLPEGNTRGFLVLRSLAGEILARGELRQKPTGAAIESALVLDFRDGSYREEVTTFTQSGVFRLEAYRLVQRGPAFPRTEITFDRKSGRYAALVQERPDVAAENASEPFDMPADLYNGMALVLIKNLAAGASATVQTAAFLPKPRLLKTILAPEGEDRVLIAGESRKVTRYLVKMEIGGLTGAMASLVGKVPPDLRYWLVPGEVPAFARFEGAMFLNGPVFRLEQTTIDWPR